MYDFAFQLEQPFATKPLTNDLVAVDIDIHLKGSEPSLSDLLSRIEPIHEKHGQHISVTSIAQLRMLASFFVQRGFEYVWIAIFGFGRAASNNILDAVKFLRLEADPIASFVLIYQYLGSGLSKPI